MNAMEIRDLARRWRDAHGNAAIAEAANKAQHFEKDGDAGQAETWRRIESALIQMRGPRES